MPDAGRNRQQPGCRLGEEELRDAPVALLARSAVVERDPDIPGRDQVAVGLLLVHAPALDPPRPNHDLVRVHDWLGPETIARIEKGKEGATMIGQGCETLEDDAFDALAELAALSVHARPVMLGDLREPVGDQLWPVVAFPHRLECKDVISARGR